MPSPQSIKDIFDNKKTVKPPAHPWQDLALRVIKELKVPDFKRNSVFKACKEHSEQEIMVALNDTKELCPRGAKWKYFFKVLANKNTKQGEEK